MRKQIVRKQARESVGKPENELTQAGDCEVVIREIDRCCQREVWGRDSGE